MKKFNYAIPKLRKNLLKIKTDCVNGSNATSDTLCGTGTINLTDECKTGNVATASGADGCESNGNIAVADQAGCLANGNNAYSTSLPAFSCSTTGGSPDNNPPNPCYTGGSA